MGDCENLFFGVGDSDFGCLINGLGWMIMGFRSVLGINRWIKMSIDVMLIQDIYVIVIGLGCLNWLWENNLYYFLDNLVFDEFFIFEFMIKDNGENFCID